jgi:hypothetical protein
VLLVGVSSIRLQMLEGAPILHDHAEARNVSETRRWMLLELPDHPRHGHEHGQPLVELPWLVDSHPDQEDNTIAFNIGCYTLCDDLRHTSITPSQVSATEVEPIDSARCQVARVSLSGS